MIELPEILSDEEIEQAIESYILSSYRNPSGDFMSSAEVAKRVTLQRKRVAQAQRDLTVKDMLRWFVEELEAGRIANTDHHIQELKNKLAELEGKSE